MNRAARNIENAIGSIDDGWAAMWQRLTTPPSRKTTLVGLVTVGLLVLVAVPVRDTLGTANIALAMAIVVTIVGIRAGLRGGTLVAVFSGGAFALLHTVPHGLPRVENGQDLTTAALLVFSGVLAGWMHDRTERLQTKIRDADFDVTSLHRAGEVAAAVESKVGDVVDVVRREIVSEMDLLECRRILEPLGAVRELRHNALIAGTDVNSTPSEIGAVMAAGVGIDLRDGTHLLLKGRPGNEIEPHQLRIAILLADYAIAVLATHSTDHPA